MRNLIITTMATGALSVAALGFAGGAVAAPSGPDSAADTVAQLESQGNRVVVNRVGAAPLSQCTVSSVRPGQDVTERVPVAGSDGTEERVRYSTVYITAHC
jgi:hypothetical protein